MIVLRLPGPESAALIVAALLATADTSTDTSTDLADAARCRSLADQIGDGLDALPTPHTAPED